MADPNTPDWASPAPSWASSQAQAAPAWASAAPAPAAAPPRPKGASGLDMLGQTWQDLTDPNHPQHDPNALESGIIGATYNPVVQSLQGNYNSAVANGIFMQPVRTAMERLGVGRQQGETDASLHQRYNNAIIASRQQAAQQMQDNTVGSYGPNASAGDRAARFGQQVLNTGAGIAANPQYFAVPGMGVGGNVATRIGTAAAGNAAVGSASDAAAQLMDMASGVKKNFDIEQNLRDAMVSGAFGGALHGAAEGAPVVSDYVKGLFNGRGVDTTPSANPQGSNIQPMTNDHIAMNAADHAQYQQLLQTGSVDDIKNFFQGKQGPQPSYSDVNTWVEHRDGQHAPVNGEPGAPNPVMQPDFNYNDQYNAHHEQQYAAQNRQAVEDHINSQMAGWKNAPNVNVVHGPEDLGDLGKGVPDDALGMFGKDGQVHVFSGRISDPDVANSVLFHEGLGHFGLAQKFGSRLDQTMQSLYDRNVGQFRAKADAYKAANPGTSDSLAMEETMAEASQNGQMKPSWQDAVGTSVRQFGRKMGLKLAYSDAEVNHILGMSHDAVVNGTDVRGNGFRGAQQDPNKFMFTGPRAREFDPAQSFEPSDGIPRNEISDRDAQFHEPINFANKLGDHLEHEELYKNYPELRDLPLLRDPAIKDKYGVQGYYSDGSEGHPLGAHIAYDPNAPGELKGTLLHEVQHAIQDKEGYPDFVRAAKNGGTGADPEVSYADHPSEKEARLVEQRMNMREGYRERTRDEVGAKFMRQDALGKEQTDPNELDFVDRLKADPRYWSDQEYRTNVNELARTRFPPDGAVNKFITRAQLNKSGVAAKGYESDYQDIEDIAKHIEENYTPNVMSRDEIKEQALEYGIKPSQLKGRDPGELATRLSKIGYAARYAEVEVRNITSKVDTPDWGPEDHVKLATAIAKRNALVEMFKGESNELGRALNTVKVFKSYTNGNLSDIMEQLHEQGSGLAHLADPTNPEGLKFARQLKQALQSNNNPKAANTLMQGVTKPYWEQYLTTFHMNAMLSALSTHVKAPVDMSTGITRNVIEKALAMPVGKIRQMIEGMTGKPVMPGVEAAELFNHIHGIATAVSDMEVYRAALHAVKTGDSSYVVNGQRTPTQFANQFGAVSNPRIPIISKPTDLIAAQDTVFRSVEMNAQLLTQATREARIQLPNGTTSDVMALGKQIARNPTPTMLKTAFAETNRTLLLNDNKLNSIVNKARTYRPGMNPGERVGAFIASNLAPFIRVESNNLLNRLIQRSPLGYLDPTGYTQAQLKMGGAEADIARTKMLYGTVLLGMYWMAADAAKNVLTGSGPSNVDKYKQFIAGGGSVQAVHENGQYNTGGQLGMSVNPFDMHNKTAQIVANAHQAWDAGMSRGQVTTATLLALGSVMHDITGMSWISDFAPGVDAITARGEQAPDKVADFIANSAKTWVPNGLGQVARLTDPVQRDTNGTGSVASSMGDRIANDVMSEIPGLRQQLPAKYSVYGNPLPNGASLTGVHTMIPGLSGNGTTETTDPAERELDRLNVTDPDHALITPVLHTVTLDSGDKVKLTPFQVEMYQHTAGRSIVEAVRNEMITPQWQAMSDADKRDEVRSIQSEAKADAREDLFNQ